MGKKKAETKHPYYRMWRGGAISWHELGVYRQVVLAVTRLYGKEDMERPAAGDFSRGGKWVNAYRCCFFFNFFV